MCVHLPTVPARESSPAPVRLQVHDGIARVALARPPLNVLDIATLRQLNEALRQCDGLDVRVVVISSALPNAFSAGVDIGDHVADRLDAMLAEVRENARLLLNLEPVTIAAIHGSTLGGGAELALLCDLVIAAEDAVVAFPEIGLAAFPPVAAALLPERLPWAITMPLLLGESIDALRAHQLGIVSAVVPRPGLDEAALDRAKTLARYSAVGLRALTTATRIERAAAILQRIDRAIATYQTLICPSRDAREGIDAYLEKRAPTWSHH